MPANPILLPFSRVFGATVAGTFQPVTGWLPTAGMDKARVMMELIGQGGALSVGVGYQTNDAPSSPPGAGTYTALGTPRTSDGVSIETSYTSISTDAAAKQFIRFGWIGKLTTGTTLRVASAAGMIDLITV